MNSFLRWAAAALVTILCAWPTAANAQSAELGAEVTVNSEAERYLRALALLSEGRPLPWSIRGFGMHEVSAILDTAPEVHPWADRTAEGERPFRWIRPLRPEAQGLWNSAFPYGWNDGSVWAGRGVTGVVRAGVDGGWGPLTFRIAPAAFFGSNASFPLADTGREGLPFADPHDPTRIDLPQRFGDGPYGRLDGGESTVRLDLLGGVVGVSAASQHWGPAQYFPFILGNNAGGYPHLFLGTSRPVNLKIVRVHGRVSYGRLEASPYADLQERRFASAVVGVVEPAFIDHLEIGGARFFHIEWREGGPILEDFLRPVEAIFKDRRDRATGGDGVITSSNQLASAFFRWAFPGAGFEVYGEYARNDHASDHRDLLLQPDHDSGYTLGVQRVWGDNPDHGLSVIRAEVLNAQRTHLMRGRPQVPFYRHSWLRQGHTHRGQVLGAAAGYGGAGSVVEFERFASWGRWSARWERMLRNDDATGGNLAWDVLHGLIGETTFFVREADVFLRGGYIHNFQRNQDGNVGNLNASVGLRVGF